MGERFEGVGRRYGDNGEKMAAGARGRVGGVDRAETLVERVICDRPRLDEAGGRKIAPRDGRRKAASRLGNF